MLIFTSYKALYWNPYKKYIHCVHIFSWTCNQGTQLIQRVLWAKVKGSSKSSGTFPLIWRWVLGQQQKGNENKMTGVLVQPVWFDILSSFFSIGKNKIKRTILTWTEGGAYGCDTERRHWPWVTWLRVVVVMEGEVRGRGRSCPATFHSLLLLLSRSLHWMSPPL